MNGNDQCGLEQVLQPPKIYTALNNYIVLTVNNALYCWSSWTELCKCLTYCLGILLQWFHIGCTGWWCFWIRHATISMHLVIVVTLPHIT